MGTSALGNLLVSEGLLTDADRRFINSTSGSRGGSFARGILALGLLDEDDLATLISERTPYRMADKDIYTDPDLEVREIIDLTLLQRLEVLPLNLEDDTLIVAMADPLDKDTIHQLEFFTGYHIKPLIATFGQIRAGLKRIIPKFKIEDSGLEQFLTNHAETAIRRLRLREHISVDVVPPTPAAGGHDDIIIEDDDYGTIDLEDDDGDEDILGNDFGEDETDLAGMEEDLSLDEDIPMEDIDDNDEDNQEEVDIDGLEMDGLGEEDDGMIGQTEEGVEESEPIDLGEDLDLSGGDDDGSADDLLDTGEEEMGADLPAEEEATELAADAADMPAEETAEAEGGGDDLAAWGLDAEDMGEEGESESTSADSPPEVADEVDGLDELAAGEEESAASESTGDAIDDLDDLLVEGAESSDGDNDVEGLDELAAAGDEGEQATDEAAAEESADAEVEGLDDLLDETSEASEASAESDDLDDLLVEGAGSETDEVEGLDELAAAGEEGAAAAADPESVEAGDDDIEGLDDLLEESDESASTAEESDDLDDLLEEGDASANETEDLEGLEESASADDDAASEPAEDVEGLDDLLEESDQTPEPSPEGEDQEVLAATEADTSASIDDVDDLDDLLDEGHDALSDDDIEALGEDDPSSNENEAPDDALAASSDVEPESMDMDDLADEPAEEEAPELPDLDDSHEDDDGVEQADPIEGLDLENEDGLQASAAAESDLGESADDDLAEDLPAEGELTDDDLADLDDDGDELIEEPTDMDAAVPSDEVEDDELPESTDEPKSSESDAVDSVSADSSQDLTILNRTMVGLNLSINFKKSAKCVADGFRQLGAEQGLFAQINFDEAKPIVGFSGGDDANESTYHELAQNLRPLHLNDQSESTWHPLSSMNDEGQNLFKDWGSDVYWCAAPTRGADAMIVVMSWAAFGENLRQPTMDLVKRVGKRIK